MNSKEFSYKLAKSLSEDLPLKFDVEETRYKYNDYDSYPIYITTPQEFRKNVDIPRHTYIEKDVLPDDVYEVFLRIGNNGYKNFGRVKDPNQVSDKIIKYLFYRFEEEIELMENPAFVFSSELKDFLKNNDYEFMGGGHGSPDLIYYNHGIKHLGLENIVIEFSEHRGDVLLVMNAYYQAPYNNTKEEEIYRSTLDRKNQKEVFTSILREIKRVDLDTGENIQKEYDDMDEYYSTHKNNEEDL